MAAITPKTLRQAQPSDEAMLNGFLRAEYYVHRHLDWRPGLAWLGRQPFWLLERNHLPLGVLACPPDPGSVHWIRLFGAAASLQPEDVWRLLFDQVLQDLANQERPPVIAALALQHWFGDLLPKTGFSHHQDIVVLTWNDQLPPPRKLHPGLRLRKLEPQDLSAAARVDEQAFEPIWRNSLESLHLAYQQAAYVTVAELNGEIIGYQLSTNSAVNTHLARLAVRPDVQRLGVAYALVTDLFAYHRAQGTWQLTVNTQHDNRASLALYDRLGFELTGEHFPVFLYHNPR